MRRLHTRSNAFKSPSFSRGVGLIEILIAVLVLAVGMLGIAALQATALRNSQSSLERSQAIMQSYAIIDAMRANRDAARINEYNLALTCAVPGTGTLAQNDLNRWVNGVKAALGDKLTTCVAIACAPVPAPPAVADVDCRIDVNWDDSRGSGGSNAQAVTTRTRI